MLAIKRFVLDNIHKMNPPQATGPVMPVNRNFYSVYIPGIKKFMRQQKPFSKMIKQIEQELDRSDTKRSDLKRKEIKFTKEQAFGYRLELTSDKGKRKTLQ